VSSQYGWEGEGATGGAAEVADDSMGLRALIRLAAARRAGGGGRGVPAGIGDSGAPGAYTPLAPSSDVSDAATVPAVFAPKGGAARRPLDYLDASTHTAAPGGGGGGGAARARRRVEPLPPLLSGGGARAARRGGGDGRWLGDGGSSARSCRIDSEAGLSASDAGPRADADADADAPRLARGKYGPSVRELRAAAALCLQRAARARWARRTLERLRGAGRARAKAAAVSAALALQAACARALAARARRLFVAACAPLLAGAPRPRLPGAARRLTSGRTAGQALAGLARVAAARRRVMKSRRVRDFESLLGGLLGDERAGAARAPPRAAPPSGRDARAALIQRAARGRLARRALRALRPDREAAAASALQRAARGRLSRLALARARRARAFARSQEFAPALSPRLRALLAPAAARRPLLARAEEGAPGAAAALLQRGTRRALARREAARARRARTGAALAAALERAWPCHVARRQLAGQRRVRAALAAAYAEADALGRVAATLLQRVWRGRRARRGAARRAAARDAAQRAHASDVHARLVAEGCYGRRASTPGGDVGAGVGRDWGAGAWAGAGRLSPELLARPLLPVWEPSGAARAVQRVLRGHWARCGVRAAIEALAAQRLQRVWRGHWARAGVGLLLPDVARRRAAARFSPRAQPARAAQVSHASWTFPRGGGGGGGFGRGCELTGPSMLSALSPWSHLMSSAGEGGGGSEVLLHERGDGAADGAADGRWASALADAFAPQGPFHTGGVQLDPLLADAFEAARLEAAGLAAWG
jgi:hypothetical protein